MTRMGMIEPVIRSCRSSRESWRTESGARADVIQLLKDEIPHLRRFAQYLCHDPDFTDDLVQETLFLAIRKISSFEPGTHLRAWLLAILKNVHCTELRRQRRCYPVSSADGLGTTSDTQSDITLAAVRDALRCLTGIHRQILLLVAVEGLTYEEASVVLGVPIGTVRSRVSRARVILRKVLEESPARRREPAAWRSSAGL